MKTKQELFEKLPVLKKTDKIMLLTHTDLDGEVPVIILKSVFKNVSMIHCPNTTMDDKIKTTVLDYADEYDFIIACDISCTENTAELIDANPNKNKFVLLDHHSTAVNLNKYNWACVHPDMIADSFRAKAYDAETIEKMHSSGTALLYDYLDYNNLILDAHNINLIEQMVQKTSNYDTWDWHDVLGNDTSCKRFNDLYYLYGSDVFETNMLEKLENNEESLFNKYDNMFLDIDRNRINETVDRMSKSFKTGTITIDKTTYTIALCFTDLYQSDVFAAMKETLPGQDIYIINHSGGLSLRSDKIDVGTISKKFGGGGHPKAGGIPISIDNKIKFISESLNVGLTLDEYTS